MASLSPPFLLPSSSRILRRPIGQNWITNSAKCGMWTQNGRSVRCFWQHRGQRWLVCNKGGIRAGYWQHSGQSKSQKSMVQAMECHRGQWHQCRSRGRFIRYRVWANFSWCAFVSRDDQRVIFLRDNCMGRPVDHAQTQSRTAEFCRFSPIPSTSRRVPQAKNSRGNIV